MKKKKGPKRSKASFAQRNVHSDKLSAYKDGSADTRTNMSGGPTNRADNELKHMMNRKPAGMTQSSRRIK